MALYDEYVDTETGEVHKVRSMQELQQALSDEEPTNFEELLKAIMIWIDEHDEYKRIY